MTNNEETILFEHEPRGEILIIRVRGRLDAISSISAEKIIFDHIHEGRIKFVLDLSGSDYLSSAGMRVLLCVAKKLKSLSGKIVVCNLTTNVMDALKMSGFEHILDVTKTEEEALRLF